MNPIVVAVAIAVTIGAVVAVSSRNARTALLGLAITVTAAPFLGDPLPQTSTLAMRVIGAALVAFLLRSAAASAVPTVNDPRPEAERLGSRVGWPAEALMAAAAWLVAIVVASRLAALEPAGPGDGASDILAMLGPAAVTTAAGLASIVVGFVPAFAGRDALRTAIGMLILIQGSFLLRAGVAGAPGDLEQIAGVALFVAVAVAGATLISIEERHEPGVVPGNASIAPLPRTQRRRDGP
ncbi:MAG: hypothetical protein ABI598_07610 [Chloroflexota bacterium]